MPLHLRRHTAAFEIQITRLDTDRPLTTEDIQQLVYALHGVGDEFRRVILTQLQAAQPASGVASVPRDIRDGRH